MTTFAAWVIAPLTLLLITAGAGMLAERVSRARLPDGVLVPVGLAVAVLVTLPLYLLGLGSSTPAVAVVLLAGAGFASGRGSRLRAVRTPAALAGLFGYLLYLGPVLLSGHWTWTGYDFVNDPSVNMVLVDHVEHAGTAVTQAVGESTAANMVIGTLGVSYPLGIHGLLATLDWLTPAPLPAVYQPFIACMAAIAAMAFCELARACRLPWPAAIGASVLALGAGLTYNYALHGAFKELAVVACVATAGCLARVALDARLHVGTVALVAVPLAAGVAITSVVAGGYAVMLGATMLIAAFAIERQRPDLSTTWRAALVASVVLLVAAAPFLKETLEFGRTAGTQFASDTTNGPSVLAHLLRPLPLTQSLGVWWRDDYRYPLEPGMLKTTTTLLIAVAGVLVAVGILAELRRRRLGALLVLAPALAVGLVGAWRLAPYGEAKLFVVMSPALVFTAALGAWWLSRRSRAGGAVAAAALAIGVLGTDAMAYHYTQLAPIARMDALQDAVDRTDGGRWMSSEWEEFAKYYGRDIKLNVAPEAYSPAPAVLRVPGEIFSRSFDLDQMTLEYVEQWDGLIVRRSPVASRPPANFSLAYQNAFYELWRREPVPQVLEHLSLGAQGTPGFMPSCDDVLALAARARPGERLVAATVPAMPQLDPLKPKLRPRTWGDAPVPDVLIPDGSGVVRASLDFAGGSYRAWVRGSAERPLTVTVDGRTVGEADGVNGPSQFLSAGIVELTPGRHTVELTRPGGGWAPGDGYRGEVGRVLFEPVPSQSRLVTVSPADARTLCGETWDWIERVAP